MSSSLTTESPAVTFVCHCAEWMRSACKNFEEYEDTGYCVLHYPSNDKSVTFDEALKEKLGNEDFNFSGVWFPDSINIFREYVFTKSVNFNHATFGARTNFNYAKFNVKANFNHATFTARASFNHIEFNQEANFHSAAFKAEAEFISTEFKAKADFQSAAFGTKAYFMKAKFGAEADFKNATFRPMADFSSAQFNAKANFSSTKFNANANFPSARFGGMADFTSAAFDGAGNFYASIFSAEVDFRLATLNSEVEFKSVVFCAGANFSYATFKDYVRFAGDEKNSVFSSESSFYLQFARIEKPDRFSFHTLTLRPHWFVNVDARKFEFINVNWDWRKVGPTQEAKNLGRGVVVSAYRLLSISCRNLAVNAEENHRYEEASKFRYWAMDARRLERWRGFAFWQLDWWYWLASGYGERMGRAFLVLLGILVLFAMLYTKLDSTNWEMKAASERTNALLYSANVMMLQKPDPRPAKLAAQSLVMLETILGPVQAALLALAIRRKFMR